MTVETGQEEELDEQQVEETETTTEKTPNVDKKQEWDQTRQFRDEISALNKREGQLAAEKERLQAELDEARELVSQSKKVAELPDASDDDLDDYDNLKKLVLNQKARLDQNEKALEDSRKVNESLTKHQQESSLREAERTGADLLAKECDALEKEFGVGTKSHRNDILTTLNKEYQDGGIAQLPDKTRIAWIKKSLRVAYYDEKAKVKTTVKKDQKGHEDAVLDTGSGGSVVMSGVPEGSMDEVFDKYVAAQRQDSG